MTYHFYFKLFNNIKSEHEAKDLARLELEKLFGNIEEIKNFFDVLEKEPLKSFTNEKTRIQDIILHELPYGKIQGYTGIKENITEEEIMFLAKRLAYTKEIFIICDKQKIDIKKLNENIFQTFENNGKTLIRIVTYQYFLEKSEYISKLSRNEEEIDKNVETLFAHPFKNIYRIPASSTLAVGKRLEDYFAIREEPSLYLTHYMHPYKGKFHPKMTRALINYVCPKKDQTVLDNFSGSGTTLVECCFLELKSKGIEINPLSALMSNVKCHALKYDVEELKKDIEELKRNISFLYNIEVIKENQKTLFSNDIELKEDEINDVFETLKRKKYEVDKETVKKALYIKKTIEKKHNNKFKEFYILCLSNSIGETFRRTKKDIVDVFIEKVKEMYLRIYLFKKINEKLKIEIPDSICIVGDTRNMEKIKDEEIDGIVNSPPYSTALDYIKNDFPQLVILRANLEKLEKEMIGNPRKNYDIKELKEMLKDENKDPLKLSEVAKKYVKTLIEHGREDAGYKVYKYFIDMLYTLKEMYRVTKKGSKCAIVIGNNHYKILDKYIEIPNDQVIIDIAKSIGFKLDALIERELQKTSVGNIKKESIVILEKN